MFVMAAVNRQRASSADEKLCVLERLNNGKTQANISSQNRIKLRHTCATRALLILQPAHGRTKLYFSADHGPNLRSQILGVIQS